MTYIAPDIIDKINETASIVDVISDHVQLKPKGVQHVGDCPNCSHRDGLEINEKKNIWKCFKCEVGGKGPASFLMKIKGYSFPEACHILADRYHIQIEEDKPKTKKMKRSARNVSFRDMQLKSSGIPDSAQKYFLPTGKGEYEMDRYQKGTVDDFWNFNADGDDMIINYIGLDGHPMKWKTSSGKEMPLVRVRWANPSLHKTKDGKEGKYKSPYGSGSHLWIPQPIIQAYKTSKIIDTLYICEGEKKADKMCLEGLHAVGVMGINNFANAGEMPYQFENLIKTCGINQVVFVLDSDWQDISISNPEKSVDARPNVFYKAVLRFRDYFKAFYNVGIELEIFFMYHTDEVHKGIDDLLVYELKEKEHELTEDIKHAMIDREGKGRYVQLHKITEMSSYALRQLWNLHSKPVFMQKHKDKLSKLREFNLNGLQYRYDKKADKFELTQKIMPTEEYWNEVFVKEDFKGDPIHKYTWSYSRILTFLRNRGFGLYEYSKDNFRFVRTTGKVISQTTPHKIQRYVQEFTREIDKPQVLELILRGGNQYMGPDKLSNMHYIKPEFHEAEATVQYLYFKNCYWKITAEGIEHRPLSELPKHVWEDNIIDFEPTYLGRPMLQAKFKKDKWGVKLEDEVHKCDMARFYMNTSDFNWKKRYYLHETEDGKKEWRLKNNPDDMTEEDIQITTSNFVCKVLAAGYVMHEYRNYGNMRAIVCMDGIESEVGKSQGGTGKSLWSKAFKYLGPQEVIDGKKKNIEDDNHLYENVDERTKVIVFDDVRVNFNFEFLFSQITSGLSVNPKGEKRFSILPPKFIINTNHALNGEGNSFERRQYTIAFSDYYNKYRTVGDEFGHQLFYEWEYDDWNLFYNWMATCIHVYLQHGLDYSINDTALQSRKLRQTIGENFIEWADVMFDSKEGPMLNARVEKVYACENYLIQFPADRRYVNPRNFKTKLKMYAEYKNLDFNLPADGDRIKMNGKEFFILSNLDFDATNVNTILSDSDLKRIENDPF